MYEPNFNNFQANHYSESNPTTNNSFSHSSSGTESTMWDTTQDLPDD